MIKYIHKPALLIFLFLVAICNISSAQTGDVKGTVLDKENGDRLSYSLVRIRNTDKRMYTDINGYFNLIKIPVGPAKLIVYKTGYDTTEIDINITEGGKLLQNVYLSPKVNRIEVEVRSNEQNKKERVEISKIEVTPEKIGYVPSIGGEPDLAQFLQIIPGVTFTGDQGGQFYVRGGAPIQNMVLLDGMTIYNPFHSIGLFSVFDVDIIKNADVFTGGFGAQYGGRISAVLDVTTRDGNQIHTGGKVNVSPFTSKLSLEGPLKKFKEGQGGSSYLLTGRTSYLKQTSKIFYPYANENGLPYNFTDLFGKLSFNSANGSAINLFGFNYKDNVNLNNLTKYGWNSYGMGGKIHLVPANSSSVIDATLAFSDYKTSQKDADQFEKRSSISGFQGRIDFSYFSNKDLIKYGIQINGFSTDFNFTNAAKVNVGQQDFTTEIAGYIRYNKVIGKLVIDPSFRVHVYASLSEVSPEPRLGLKFNVTPSFRLKAAGGLYSQNLLSAQSDRDVVNLFYGFLSGPENLPNNFDGKNITSALQKARHLIAGTEIDITKNIGIQVEGYLKDFNQLTNINRNKIYNDDASNNDKPQSLKSDYIIETGLAKGVDFQITYDKKPAYFYISYSLGQVTRFDGNNTYFPHWDRRHNLNILGAYKLGKAQNWEFSARFAFGSGFPFSKTQGYYELIDFQQGGVNTDYTQSNGLLGILYSGLNNGRLSTYHRMDVSLKRTYDFTKYRKLQVIASVTNTYNRENVFYFDRVNNIRVNQLPILPSIALNYSF